MDKDDHVPTWRFSVWGTAVFILFVSPYVFWKSSFLITPIRITHCVLIMLVEWKFIKCLAMLKNHFIRVLHAEECFGFLFNFFSRTHTDWLNFHGFADRYTFCWTHVRCHYLALLLLILVVCINWKFNPNTASVWVCHFAVCVLRMAKSACL